MVKKQQKSKDMKTVKACPLCGSDNVVYSDAEKALVCKDCGHIFEEV